MRHHSSGTEANVVPFVTRLADFGPHPALISSDEIVSYGELARRVGSCAHELGHEHRLTVVAVSNTVGSIVSYLGALAARHAVILAPADRAEIVKSLIAQYDPDTVVRAENGARLVETRHTKPVHALHPELALLLSTSGSTGSPKLVRLSQANLQANAEAIRSYLAIRTTDRAITTLPLHYCYGLSVLHSYLAAGGSLVLTDQSVTEDPFWQLFRQHRVTSLAGVPHTFDLLDAVGFGSMDLPHLRYITQAGGRLPPERVKRFATLGMRSGWDFYVMYGQTEATARMAYLPAHLATQHPEAIGVPIPGGSFRLDPHPDWPGDDVGELVFSGPNVMLGYAETPLDLSLGRTVHELHTGDIGRRNESGMFEIIGRKSRFIKPFGLRVDLQRIEGLLAEHGMPAVCTGNDDALVIGLLPTTDSTHDRKNAQRLVRDATGLPHHAVLVVFLDEVPRLGNGKIDYREILQRSRPQRQADDHGGVRALFGKVFGSAEIDEDCTFADLGGDSLTYARMSMALEQLVGTLPARWPTMTIRELSALKPNHGRKRSTLDSSILLRAMAICLILGNHAALFNIQGGAHLLLGLVGFNFGRFQLAGSNVGDSARLILRSVARVAGFAALWIALVHFTLGDYAVPNIFLLNFLFGTSTDNSEWVFWFIKAVVCILLAMAALLTIPAWRSWLSRFPFGLPFGLMTAGLIARYELIPGVTTTNFRFTSLTVFWLFALGWAIAKSTALWHRILVTGAAVATVPGFFGQPEREALVIAGLLMVTWLPALPSMRMLSKVSAALAGASFYIYIIHWALLSRIERGVLVIAPSADAIVPIAKFAISVAFGLFITALAERAHWAISRARSARRHA